MTTAVEAKVSVSPEVKAVHRRMRRRQALARGLTYLVGILISLWVLIPIIFIASMALTTPAMVRAYPKSILPFIPFSTATMEFFLNSRGILPGIRNSVVVALITLTLSTLISAPAGYAISRFIFRGRNVFRLAILAVRAFPIVVLSIPLAVVFLRVGIYDTV
jgi:multiple sugar transport system permease protein